MIGANPKCVEKSSAHLKSVSFPNPC